MEFPGCGFVAMGIEIRMTKRNQQLAFDLLAHKRPQDCFGGSLLKSHPKTRRPLASKLPIHLVLRSRSSRMRLPKTFLEVNQIVTMTAKKCGVTIYSYANVGNHLHLVIRILSVRRWSAFIRELTGRIAQFILAGLGNSKKDEETFWAHRPFTRIVRGWQRAFRSIIQYVSLNRLEADGFISRKEIKTLQDLNRLWADSEWVAQNRLCTSRASQSRS